MGRTGRHRRHGALGQIQRQTRRCRGLLSVRGPAGFRHLPGEQLAGLLDVYAPDHDGPRARRGSDPVQQTFLRLPLSAGHRRRMDGPRRKETAPAGRRSLGQRRGQTAARGEIRAAFHDSLFHALVERAVLQETRSVLCRGYGIQGRDRALDVAHEPYAVAAGAFDVWDVNSNGSVSNGTAANSNAVAPSIYLKSNVLIESGTGTSSNPYELSL